MMVFNKHVKVRREKFGSVIFETLKEKVYVTNETASDILELITEGRDEEGIVENLCQVYKGDLGRINKDVASFIDELREKGLLAG